MDATSYPAEACLCVAGSEQTAWWIRETTSIHLLLARYPAPALAGILLAFAGQLHAQETDDPAPATDVPTLERVLAVLPDEEALDLYTFRNPVAVEPNRFEEMYELPPSPEEIAMQHGGLINYGINLGLQKS